MNDKTMNFKAYVESQGGTFDGDPTSMPLVVEAAAPHAGVWWVGPDGRLISFDRSVRDDPGFALGSVDPEFDHMQVWTQVQRRYPALAGRDYIDLPRGRVSMRTLQGQRLYFINTSNALSADPRVINQVMRHYHLPPAGTRIVADMHYDMTGHDFDAEAHED